MPALTDSDRRKKRTAEVSAVAGRRYGEAVRVKIREREGAAVDVREGEKQRAECTEGTKEKTGEVIGEGEKNEVFRWKQEMRKRCG